MIALEGDGSLLMQLGCLTTVAALKPKNLTMVIMDNGLYQITGGQPTPAAGIADYVALARAAGLANSAWAADEEDFEGLIDLALAEGGPTFIARPHRRQAGRRRHRPRPRADPRALHAGAGRAGDAVGAVTAVARVERSETRGSVADRIGWSPDFAGAQSGLRLLVPILTRSLIVTIRT